MTTAAKTPKSRYRLYRALSLLGVNVFMGLHLAHWYFSGTTLSPLEPTEFLHTLHRGVITVGFVFFIVLMIATLTVGRFFCGWLCHIMALQDFSAGLLNRLRIRPEPIKSRTLLWIPFLAMFYLFIWPQVERIWIAEPFPQLVVQEAADEWGSFMTDDLWRSFPGPWISVLTLFSCGFVIIYVLGSRSFCRYGCPYGAIFSGLDRFAPGRIVLGGECTKCGVCTANCKSQVDVSREINTFGTVVDSNCMKSFDCVSSCPQTAISYGFTKPPLARTVPQRRGRSEKYSFSVAEDVQLAVVFSASFLALRSLYDSVPILLSLCLGVLVAFISVVCVRLVHGTEVRATNLVLKRAGKVTRQGRGFLGAAACVALLMTHSGWVRYQEFMGNRALAAVVPAGAGLHLVTRLSAEDEETARSALARFQKVYDWGLYRSAILRRRLVTLYSLDGAYDDAEDVLRKRLEKAPEEAETRLYLATVLLRSNRGSEGLAQLDRVIEAELPVRRRPALQTRGKARALRAHAAAQSGRIEEAIEQYELAVEDYAGHSSAQLALGSLLYRKGQPEKALPHLQKSVELNPHSPAAHKNLGVVYVALDRTGDAIRHYEKLIELSPQDAGSVMTLAVLYLDEGRLAQSRRTFQRLLAQQPDSAEAHDGLAIVLARQGEVAGARKHREKAAELRTNPD